MTKVIVSQMMTGNYFSDIVFNEANKMAIEKGMDPSEVIEKISACPTMIDVKAVLNDYFGDELKIKSIN